MDQIDDPETGRGLIVYIVDFVNIRLGKIAVNMKAVGPYAACS